ncbi:MAG: RsmE family RNA methyltransferase [Patescibacteria group bacterium]
MRLHRFYTKDHLAGQEEITLRDEAALHQLRDVFRLAKGDRVIFFNGDGSDYIYEANIISKKEAGFGFVETTGNIAISKKVTLYMSLIKKDNFEMVLEKATEIGVTHFVPVVTERTLGKNLNMERAERIMKEASEQCGRGDVPTIGEIMDLEDVLKENPDVIIFDMDGKDLKNYKPEGDEHKMLIGPEGGWSEKELQMFKDLKIQTFKLGDTVLRAETAAIVASAFVINSQSI